MYRRIQITLPMDRNIHYAYLGVDYKRTAIFFMVNDWKIGSTSLCATMMYISIYYKYLCVYIL